MPNAQIAYLETIESLLAKNKMQEAISALLDFVSRKTDLRQDILLLSARFEGAQAEQRKGTISYDNYSISVNNIFHALIGLINNLKERADTEVVGTVPDPTTSSAKDGSTANTGSEIPTPSPVSTVPKFVIVYDEADRPQCQMLNKHLNVLKLTKKIRVYNVQDGVGNLVSNAETELADADYVLALVTVNLFNSPDWFTLVINALEQNRRIIPIRIERADYDGTGLEKLRSLPSLGRAVSDFPNLDAAYVDIVTELKKLLPK